MSRGINKVILVGNVGNDPEIKYSQSGKPVANLSIATSESWKDKNTGENQVKTEWHRIVAWDKLADIIGKYVTKGSQIYIEGKLQTRKWQDQNGIDRYTTEVVASTMQMLGSKNDGGQPSQPRSQPQQQRQPSSHENNFEDEFDDEIPF